MQELRSTELLDKEILNDARKKAEKIRKKTEEEIEQILSSVDDDIQKAQYEKEAFYAEKLLAYENNLKASIPLEKNRIKISYLYKSVINKITEYLSSLPEEKKLELVLKQIPATCIEKTAEIEKFTAYIYGFDFSSAKKMLEKMYKSSITEYKKVAFGEVASEENPLNSMTEMKGIILESINKNYRYRLTISEIIGKLLDEKREELVASLFGGLD